MKSWAKRLHHMEQKLDNGAEGFAFRHPWLGFLLLFIGFPIFILGAVFLGTSAIMFPISWLCGWL